MSDAVTLIYVTAPDAAAAHAIGHTIVAERLAACANILPGMRSIYWWQGKLEEAPEAVLILKTVASAAERVIARARAAQLRGAVRDRAADRRRQPRLPRLDPRRGARLRADHSVM